MKREIFWLEYDYKTEDYLIKSGKLCSAMACSVAYTTREQAEKGKEKLANICRLFDQMRTPTKNYDTQEVRKHIAHRIKQLRALRHDWITLNKKDLIEDCDARLSEVIYIASVFNRLQQQGPRP